MKLPIIDIRLSGDTNLNPEGPKVTLHGPGTAELNTDNVLSPERTFILKGGLAYGTDVAVDTDWTLEVYPKEGNRFNGALVGGDILGLASNITSFYLNVSGRILDIYHVTDKLATRRLRGYIPKDVYEAGNSLQVVKRDNRLYIHSNGVPVWEFTLESDWFGGTVTFMSRRTGELSVSGSHNHEYEAILFNPDHTLEPKMFYKGVSTRSRDLDNSYFIDEDYVASDFNVLAVESFSTYFNRIVVRYNDGSMESFYRPRGLDSGNTITDVGIVEGSLVITLDDGTTISPGILQGDLEKEVGSLPTGQGYKVGDTCLPFNVSGDLFYIKNGKVAMNFSTLNSVDYKTRVRYVSEAHATVSRMTYYQIDQNNFRVPKVEISHGNFYPNLYEKGSLVLPPGIYYADGYVTLPMGAGISLSLMNNKDEALLVTGTGPATTPTNLPLLNTKVRGHLFIVEPTTVSFKMVGYSGTIDGKTLPYGSNIIDVSLFKVA